MTKDDPIVQRVREARKAIIARCGGDMRRIFDYLKQIEAAHKDRVVGYERRETREK